MTKVLLVFLYLFYNLIKKEKMGYSIYPVTGHRIKTRITSMNFQRVSFFRKGFIFLPEKLVRVEVTGPTSSPG